MTASAGLALVGSVPDRSDDANRAMLARFEGQDRRRRLRERWFVAGGQVGLILFIGLVWQAASGRLIDATAVSDPISVVKALWSLAWSGRLWPNFYQTLVEVLAGFSVGAGVGVALALVFAVWPSAQTVLRPFLLAFYAIPKIALAPLIIMWFGLGTLPKVVLAAAFVFFIVFMNVAAGIESVSQRHMMLARLMGASRLQLMTKIILPTTLPYLLTGLRLAIPEAVLGAVIGEFIAANVGLGHLVSTASAQFNMAVSFAAIFALLAIVAAGDWLISRVESRLLEFRPGGSADITGL